jgi:hypothetical protein
MDKMTERPPETMAKLSTEESQKRGEEVSGKLKYFDAPLLWEANQLIFVLDRKSYLRPP